MTLETWVPIVGHESYEVSDLGRVRSNATYHGVRPPRVMKPDTDNYGYPVIRFNARGARVKRRVHLLVIRAFRGPAPDGTVTRHLNGNPLDNRLANLAYGTQGQNIADAVTHGTHFWSSRTHCANGHEFTPENTRRKPSKAGRICITCDRARSRRQQARRRAVLRAAS